jgi:hypothetical protein
MYLFELKKLEGIQWGTTESLLSSGVLDPDFRQ